MYNYLYISIKYYEVELENIFFQQFSDFKFNWE